MIILTIEAKKKAESLSFSLDIFIICNACTRIEVHDFETISLCTPLPPEKMMTVFAIDHGTQRVPDIIIEGGIAELQGQV